MTNNATFQWNKEVKERLSHKSEAATQGRKLRRRRRRRITSRTRTRRRASSKKNNKNKNKKTTRTRTTRTRKTRTTRTRTSRKTRRTRTGIISGEKKTLMKLANLGSYYGLCSRPQTLACVVCC